MENIKYTIVTILLVVALLFVGVFGFVYSYARNSRMLEFSNAYVIDGVLNETSYEQQTYLRPYFFKSNSQSNIYDRLVVYYKLNQYDNLSDVFSVSNIMDLSYIGVVYDISSYDLVDFTEFFYVDFNTLYVDISYFNSAYVLPYAMTDNDEIDVDITNYLIHSFIETGRDVPYYNLLSCDIELSISAQSNSNALAYVIHNDNYIITLDTSLYSYFKGLVGSLGVLSNTYNFPKFDFAFESITDTPRAISYLFEYMGKIGDLIRVTFGTFVYGFIPTYFFLGG